MDGIHGNGSSELQAISNAMVRLHKEQFGRGPTNARAYFAGPDIMVCMLQDVLLPAERKMVELGAAERVRETRVAFQAATQTTFIEVIEDIVHRKVQAFASGLDPDANTVFETYYFSPGQPPRD
jgi:uncharacterized protein YbcI